MDKKVSLSKLGKEIFLRVQASFVLKNLKKTFIKDAFIFFQIKTWLPLIEKGWHMLCGHFALSPTGHKKKLWDMPIRNINVWKERPIP